MFRMTHYRAKTLAVFIERKDNLHQCGEDSYSSLERQT